MKSRPPTEFLCVKIITAFLLTASISWAQDNSSNNSNDVSALKAQIEKMQRDYDSHVEKIQQQYEDRISSMEAEMKALESKADSGSILNTRILTDADGKEVSSGQTLDESFLKSLTRNFTFSAYVRAGFMFNGNGGGGNFNFAIPDNFEAGRLRYGNENDAYMELTWQQAHMLGDSPDVMDVSMLYTLALRYQDNRSTFDGAPGQGLVLSGNDAQFILRQAFVDAKNVFKNAPEVDFWGGILFYDRWNTDPEDYFWLDTSGYGVGVRNIDLGIGKLWVAWLEGLNANYEGGDIGTLQKQTFDVRLKDMNVGFGSLTAVLIGNIERGGTFDQTYDQIGNLVPLTNPLHVDSAWGIGGGLIYKVNFGPGGSNNSFTAYALFGRGATNFSASDDLSYNGYWTGGAENYYLFKHPGLLPGQTVSTQNAIDHQKTFRAGFQAYVALPWYHSEPAPAAGMSKDGKGVAPAPGPTTAPGLPWFSLGIFGDWQHSDAGTFLASAPNAANFKIISGVTNDLQGGIRPAVWFADNFAFQGQFGVQYESNNRATPGLTAYGRPGTLGVFSFGPVLKPKGGYFTRPEIRLFATYAVWTNSLKGVVTPIQENGINGDFQPPYNGNTNHGWLFGSQVEWFF
jgi:maltoporin